MTKVLQFSTGLLKKLFIFQSRGGGGGDEKAGLEDEKWLFDLTFVADFTGKLSDMNLELRGKTNALLR
jgi:hypothetical protein